MKIAYLGFDLFFECLEYLSDNYEVIKIFTCDVDGDYEKNVRTYSLAKEKNIPITTERITSEDIEQLERSECDLIISAGYYFKIPVSDKIKSINFSRFQPVRNPMVFVLKSNSGLYNPVPILKILISSNL